MTDVQVNGHREDSPPLALPEILTVPRDTSFEHPLDETAPKPEPVHDGDGIEIPRLGGERLPIVPEHLRTLAGIWAAAYKYLDAAWFHSAFHAAALAQVPRLVGRGGPWSAWSASPGSSSRGGGSPSSGNLRSKAVVDGNSPEWRALHSHVIKRRSWRGAVPRRRAVRRSCSCSSWSPRSPRGGRGSSSPPWPCRRSPAPAVPTTARSSSPR